MIEGEWRNWKGGREEGRKGRREGGRKGFKGKNRDMKMLAK